MDPRNVQSQLFEQFARIGKALASPGRLEILDLLCQGEKTVESLAEETGMKVGNTSAHLRALRQARLVETRKDGLYVFYRVADGSVGPLLAALRAVAERRLAEVREVTRRHFRDPEGAIVPERRELLERLGRGEVTLVDARPQDEYRAGHIFGARSIPIAELPDRLEEIPTDRDVVVYCRGRYSFLSLNAVTLLRKRGFRAMRLPEGVTEWRTAGLPVEGGER